jgi:hypothetical protein
LDPVGSLKKKKSQKSQTNHLLSQKSNTQPSGVSHFGLAIYIERYLKAKEEL